MNLNKQHIGLIRALFLLLFASRAAWGILHSEAIGGDTLPDVKTTTPVSESTTTQQIVNDKPTEPNFVIYESSTLSNQHTVSATTNLMTTSTSDQISDPLSNSQATIVLSNQYTTSTDQEIASSSTTSSYSDTTDGLVTPAPATTLATPTVTPESSIVVVVNKAEMESFEEWKEMKLKEAATATITPSSVNSGDSASSSSSDKAKTDENGENGSSAGGSTSTNHQSNGAGSTNGAGTASPSSSINTDQKESTNSKETLAAGRRKNYASIDCGAKIIASNPDASNAGHVLTESKDDYMLNSCSSKIWFVVELCEPIKISEIQIANFELFSNVPRQFRVYASERYLASPNGNNWPNKYFLGLYEAANSRSIQSFYIKDAVLNTASSSQNGTSSDQVDASGRQNGSMVEPTSVIMYAKYIKFEMLSHYGQEHFCPLSLVRIFGTSIVDEDDEAHDANARLLDETVKLEEQAKTETTTINPQTTSHQTPQIKEPSGAKEKKPKMFAMFLNNIISLFIQENFNIQKIFSSFSTSEDLSKQSTENPASQTSTSTPATTLSSSMIPENRNPIHFDLQTEDQDSNMKRNQILQIDLHKLLCFSSNHKLVLDCCKCLLDHKSYAGKKSSAGRSSSIDVKFDTFNYYGTATPNTWLSKYCGYYFLMITTAQARSNSSLLFKFIKNIRSNGTHDQDLNATNFTHIMINDVNYFINNKWLDDQAAHSLLSTFTNTTSNNLSNSTAQSETNERVKLEENRNQGNDSREQVIQTPTPPIGSQTVLTDDKSSTSEKLTESSTPQTTTTSTASTTTVSSNTASSDQTTTQASSTSTTTPSPSVSPTPTVSTTPIVIANGKDAVFMRLNNRIKILELNMSLSSQYLEKLSQHYRKQIDEMQRAFNLTTTALIETIRVADERDVKQNEKIIAMEKRVEKMQQNIDSLNLLLNDLKFQTDIIIWTIIVMFHTILAIELVRCVKNHVNKRLLRTRSSVAETQTEMSVNGLMQYEIEQMVNSRVQTLMDREYKEKLASLEHEISRLKGHTEHGGSTTPNMIMSSSHHVVDTMGPQSHDEMSLDQQKVAATLAVVAAVSITAAANANLLQCSNLPSQTAATSANEE